MATHLHFVMNANRFSDPKQTGDKIIEPARHISCNRVFFLKGLYVLYNHMRRLTLIVIIPVLDTCLKYLYNGL